GCRDARHHDGRAGMHHPQPLSDEPVCAQCMNAMMVFMTRCSILVLGADGFLGRYASAWTHPHRAHLHLAVHHAASVPKLPSHARHEDVQVSICDLTSDSDVDGLLARTRPDWIWHCAGLTTERDPSALVRVNVEGTFRLCESLHRLGRPCR